MSIVVAGLVVAVVIWLITAPLRAGHAERQVATVSAEQAELEAMKEAKYREIRDADLDHRTGKLSEADWRETDRALRAEAIDLLRRIDALGSDPPQP